MAKIADVFGQLEAFSFSILLYVLGYVQMACSQNVQTFTSAQLFYAAGFTGLQILQQIFIADTTNLLNRALCSTLPNLPFLLTVWVGPIIGGALVTVSGWRWAYGMWALILPVTFVPLALTLFFHGRRPRENTEVLPETSRPARGLLQAAKHLFFDLDVGGIILLTTALGLILVPLTLVTTVSGRWSNGYTIAMFVSGLVLLIAFPFWESSPRVAPYPFIPLHLLKSWTFCAGLGVGFFYFSKKLPLYYWPPFHPSPAPLTSIASIAPTNRKDQ
jgi:MFS family permease